MNTRAPVGYRCADCGRLSYAPGGNCEHEHFEPLWTDGSQVDRQGNLTLAAEADR